MAKVSNRTRETARRLFLTGEMRLNSEIAARLGVKPHTVGAWRKEEAWDDLRIRVDKRAAEKLIEQLSTEKVTLNVRHYKYWEYLLTQMVEGFRGSKYGVRDWEKISGILERAQKGQRLARGLATSGETEESVRAQAQMEIRRLIDAFVTSVKEHVTDEETRDRIRRAIFDALPEKEDGGTGEPGDPVTH